MIDLYDGSLNNHACAPALTSKKTVEILKNMNADCSSGSEVTVIGLLSDSDEGWPRTEVYALIACTRLIATATAPWPDMTDCMAVGPNKEATATMAVCRYDPAAA